jgi:cytochrome c oxidase subunit IV
VFSLVLITGVMGMQFLVTDHGLHKQWPQDYDRWLQWVLTLALLAGWALAVFVDVSSDVLTLCYAFLAGVRPLELFA